MKKVATLVLSLGLVLLMSSGALAQDYPPDAPSAGVSDTEVLPGQPITVTGDGWQPGSEVAITLHCPEGYVRALGTATVAADGTFSTQVTIPEDAPPGECILRVTGVGADGQARTVDVTLTIVAPDDPAPAPALVTTGGPITIGAALAFVLLVLGGLALSVARRRQVPSRA